MAEASLLFLRRFCGVLPLVLTVSHTQGGIATIRGASMQPTLNDEEDRVWNDRVTVDRWSVHRAEWRRGDVALLSSPHDRRKKLIKRVVGLEGDWIRARSGELIVVPRGKIWVEGDNNANSSDSNDFGAVPLALLDGIARSIVWPPSRRGAIAPPAQENERVLFVASDSGGKLKLKRKGGQVPAPSTVEESKVEVKKLEPEPSVGVGVGAGNGAGSGNGAGVPRVRLTETS